MSDPTGDASSSIQQLPPAVYWSLLVIFDAMLAELPTQYREGGPIPPYPTNDPCQFLNSILVLLHDPSMEPAV